MILNVKPNPPRILMNDLQSVLKKRKYINGAVKMNRVEVEFKKGARLEDPIHKNSQRVSL